MLAVIQLIGRSALAVRIESTKLEGVHILTPDRHNDARGFFAELWNRSHLRDAGLDIDFVQDNHSHSGAAGTVRGLHYQSPPHAQAKLVRCAKGALFDVVVDIRLGSPTYGEWVGLELTQDNGRQILISEGFAHGFVTRAPDTEICYKCSNQYKPQSEGAIFWCDPDLGIDWGLGSEEPILSEKDKLAPRLSEIESPFTFNGSEA